MADIPVDQMTVAQAKAELARLGETMLFTGREVTSLSSSIGGGLRRAFDGLVFDGMRLSDALAGAIRRRIRENTTPRHVPAKIVQVEDIPRTKSGKIVELAVRNVVHCRPVKNQEALANPEALAHFRDRPELAG